MYRLSHHCMVFASRRGDFIQTHTVAILFAAVWAHVALDKACV